MKLLILALGMFVMSASSFATENVTLKTSRGSEVHVTLHIPQGSNLPAIVVAPGQSCNSKGALFETLGNLGDGEKLAVVRFEWSYCNSNPSQPTPSADLKNEIEDFKTVLEFAKSHAAIDKNSIILAGKSLGSLVSYSVFANEPSAKGLILFTPICSYTTDDNGNLLPEPLNVCDDNYPKIKEDKRPVLMTMGNGDSLCLIPVLYDFLKDSKGNIAIVVAGGDHGFRSKDSAGAVDKAKTQKNINSVVTSALNWVLLNL